MSRTVWVETDSTMHSKVSTKACSLFLPLWLHMNRDNEITKQTLCDKAGYFTDSRTWNKYWKELIEVGMLRQVNKKCWMINPHEAYIDGATHNTLIGRWNAIS